MRLSQLAAENKWLELICWFSMYSHTLLPSGTNHTLSTALQASPQIEMIVDDRTGTLILGVSRPGGMHDVFRATDNLQLRKVKHCRVRFSSLTASVRIWRSQEMIGERFVAPSRGTARPPAYDACGESKLVKRTAKPFAEVPLPQVRGSSTVPEPSKLIEGVRRVSISVCLHNFISH